MKLNLTNLYNLHTSLCHPGVTKMAHFVCNLPFSVEDAKRMTASFKICFKCKPHQHSSDAMHFIKATQPFEQFNLDFRPMPTYYQNKYILTVLDEFSRFPFAFPSKDVSAASVIGHLRTLMFLVCVRTCI